MPIQGWFPTPIYYNYVTDLDTVQRSFDVVFADLKARDQFQRVKQWNDRSQLLSDNTFTRNLFTDYNLTEFQQQLFGHVEQFVLEMGLMGGKIPRYAVTTAWMTITPKGHQSHVHSHGPADISGVYYYQTNGHDGSIFFQNPNNRLLERTRVFYDSAYKHISYAPEIGKLLLFPGWLEHGTAENKTDHERVSVSFNIIFDRHDGLDIA